MLQHLSRNRKHHGKTPQHGAIIRMCAKRSSKNGKKYIYRSYLSSQISLVRPWKTPLLVLPPGIQVLPKLPPEFLLYWSILFNLKTPNSEKHKTSALSSRATTQQNLYHHRKKCSLCLNLQLLIIQLVKKLCCILSHSVFLKFCFQLYMKTNKYY